MKILHTIDIIIEGGIALFFLALLFMPFHVFTRFAFPVFSVILLIFVGNLIYELYAFAKNSQKRRENVVQPAVGKRILGMRVKTVVEWTGIIILLIVLWNFQKGNFGSKECPDFISNNKSVEIDIFYNPFCPACWTIENEVFKLKDIKIVNYDVRYCTRHTELGLYGSPSFAIIKNNTILSKGYGVQELQQAIRLL